MRRLVRLVALVPLTACLQLSTGDGTGGGSGDPASGAPAGSATSSKGATRGTGCTTDPDTGAVLCAAIDNCPGLVLDTDVMNGCGFRLHAATTIDLECSCSGALCPLGVAKSCAAAQDLLAQQVSSLVVCEELNEGVCTP
jgi:hypothetical protein